jgi:hypothetical protein
MSAFNTTFGLFFIDPEYASLIAIERDRIAVFF